jgi:hypothetical protein
LAHGRSDDRAVERLTEIETVTINLPVAGSAFSVRDFDCRVIAVAGSTAVLQPSGVTAGRLPDRLDGALVSFVHEGRLFGFKGTLSREQGMTLRFHSADGAHASSGRRSTRVPVEIPVKLTHAERHDQAEGTTVNIATEGVLIRSALAVATDDILELELDLNGPLTTRGRVVRHADDLLAVEFRRDAHPITSEFVIQEKLRAQPV